MAYNVKRGSVVGTTPKLPQPSQQQQAIMDYVKANPGKHVSINAVPGSGKTTTLRMLIGQLKGKVLYLAFGNKIVAEMKAGYGVTDPKVQTIDLPNCELTITTCHSLGWRTLLRSRGYGQVQLEDKKVWNLMDTIQVPQEYRSFCKELVKQAKSRLAGMLFPIDSTDHYHAIVDHFGIDSKLEENGKPIDDVLSEAVDWSIRLLKASRQQRDVADYDDQLYEPVVSGARFFKYDYILMDESQDSNDGRRVMVKVSMNPDTTCIFVGDEGQSIMGFAGADNDAIRRIVKEFNCHELPLSVCYRCSIAAVKAAQREFNHIQWAPGAVEGKESQIDIAELRAMAKSLTVKDVILCRNTKPLVETAFNLLKLGVACHVEGKDIGGQVLALVNKWKRVKTIDALANKLDDYREKMNTRYMAKGQEDKAERLNDQIETLLVLMQGCDTLDCVRDKIAAMFQDADKMPKKVLTLSTVHKAKGREWDNRVFILGRYEYMPSKYARRDWQVYQEKCLIYVAVTRTKNELVYVNTGEASKAA